MYNEDFIEYLKTLPKKTKILVVEHIDAEWEAYTDNIPLKVGENTEFNKSNENPELCIGE
jgi:hypothetical protein